MIAPITEVKIGLDFGSEIQPVGRLAIRNNIIYFEYNDAFIQNGMEISPLRLPLRLFIPHSIKNQKAALSKELFL